MGITATNVLAQLQTLANPEKALYKAQKFGIHAEQTLGIYQADLKALAKKLPASKELALGLYDTGVYEARILCAKLFPIDELEEEYLEKWIQDFENWEICDTFCMGLFAKSSWAGSKIQEWATRTNEYEKRASFATLAAYCMAAKKADNASFEQFFPLIEAAATDERLYVKKAVNWALRNIGKRNIDVQQAAKVCAHRLLQMPSKSAQWIAKDALRQWNKPQYKYLDYPRAIYRPKS
ncbi:MAG: DNA alkylation repair protein [Aureispira sp.]